MVQSFGLSVVLLIAVLIGLFAGLWLQYKYNTLSKKTFAHNYYRGMSYLLNEQIDNPVDKFIDSLGVNGDTLEIHLALGNLMRKKGEAAKAIQIHQNLLNSNVLTTRQQHEAQLELARDYINAGLLDRAESLLQELAEVNSQYQEQALGQLVEIYQDEKEWSRAIHAANLLSEVSSEKQPKELRVAKAHFCCELALISIEQGDFTQAGKYLKQAIGFDKNCVRASLISAELALQQKRLDEALGAIKSIPQQNPNLIHLSLPLLCQVYEQIGDEDALLAELLLLEESYPSNDVLLVTAEKLRKLRGDHAATEFISARLKVNPSIRPLIKLLDMQLSSTEGKANENLHLLKQLLDKVIAEKPNYHCTKCGFVGNHLHWLCPGCKAWGSIKLIKGVVGNG